MDNLKILNHHIVRPRNHGGYAHASEARILYYDPDLKSGLCWESGGNYWSSREQKYSPSELSTFTVCIDRHHSGKVEEMNGMLVTLYREGGRLSKEVFLKNQAAIDEKFGEGTAEYLSDHYKKGTVYKSKTDLEFDDLFKHIIGERYLRSFKYDLEQKLVRNEARNKEQKKKNKNPELYRLNKRLKEIQERIESTSYTLSRLKTEENSILEAIKKQS